MTRPAFAWLSALAVLFGAGCSIPLSDFAAGPQNACESLSDCGADAVCADVGERRACVATTADLGGLLLEIRPGYDSSVGPANTYLIEVDEDVLKRSSPDGARVIDFDPELPALARVDGIVSLNGGTYCGRLVDQGSYPVEVEFWRVSPFPGLNDQRYSTVSVPDGAGQAYNIEVPSGLYNIYLVPSMGDDCVDPPPPVFLPNQEVTDQQGSEIPTSRPETLEGQLHVPASISVQDWLLDVVESVSGNVISQVERLAQQDPQAPAAFDIEFSWPDRKAFTPLIRLRPKDGDPGPTVFWDISAVALTGSTQGLNLSLFDLDAAPRHVEVNALDADGNPVVSFIRIQSAKISGDVANAAFKLELDTDAYGFFSADLPPGEYRIFAQPLDPTKALAAKDLKFPAGNGCICGQSILIPSRGTLRGTAIGPAGESMDAAQVFATPSITGATTYLNRVLGGDAVALLPREVKATVVDGTFSIAMDPGQFDFSVRPPLGSTYPWRVRSRLLVTSGDPPPVTDLELTVPYPAVLKGVIRSAPDADLSNAVVSAWLPVTDSSGGVGVIQIGETRADAFGSYVLPLPPSIAQ